MIFLNAGNLWDNEYLDTVIRWNEEFRDTIQVKSLFGSIAKLTPTARAADRLPYLEWVQIDKYVDKCVKNGIAVRYTLNQSCIGAIQDFRHDWDAKLRGDIEELHNIGIHEWTITSPLLMELLRDMFPDDFLEVSTIAEVATPEDAKRWLELGANGVNVATVINRNFPLLRGIIKTGIETSILANEACLFRCLWRAECYNLSSHNSLRSEELFGFYPFRRCTEVRLADPVEWLKSRLILPQWMRVFQERLGVSWFKVAYRTHPKEVALPILRWYMEQDFHGSLLELWPTITNLGNTLEPKDTCKIPVDELEKSGFLEHFITHGHECQQLACEECRYCKRVYQLATGNK